jgi:L-asparaginase
MRRVAVIFTGGTISNVFDPVAGGNVPALDGAAILARTPGLDTIADVVPFDRGRTSASHFTFPQLLLAGPKPVVVTGAMLASDAAGFDGPANLRNAVRVAAAPEMREAGVVVCLAGTIEAADDVQKSHATALDTFRSPNGGPVGRVGEGGVELVRSRGARRRIATDHAAERVYLVIATVATDSVLLDAAVAAGADGIVVAATGSGNTDPSLLAAAERAIAAGIPVALASRCPGGRATAGYAFPGGGATWLRAGALPVGHLCALKARVALALGIGAELDRTGLAALLADP